MQSFLTNLIIFLLKLWLLSKDCATCIFYQALSPRTLTLLLVKCLDAEWREDLNAFFGIFLISPCTCHCCLHTFISAQNDWLTFWALMVGTAPRNTTEGVHGLIETKNAISSGGLARPGTVKQHSLQEFISLLFSLMLWIWLIDCLHRERQCRWWWAYEHLWVCLT